MNYKNLFRKVTAFIVALASVFSFTVAVGAEVDYSGNIYYTGGYDCSPNTEGFITVAKDKIGVMAYMTDRNCFIRAISTVGTITSNYFTAKFQSPAKCDINGNFTGTNLAGEVIIQGDVEIYSEWLFGEKYIKVLNKGKKVNNQQQTFIKPFSRHYY